jgi:Protein of unknown function (DUF2800)
VKNLSLDLDPRHGLASASSMHRIAECSGSLALSNWVRRNGYFVPRNPWALTGTAIHRWLAFEALGQHAEAEVQAEALDPEALDVAIKCAWIRDGLVRAWENDHDRNFDFFTAVERRYRYFAGEVEKFNGQPDFIRINLAGRRALIVNYKTGRIEPEPAADNLQLRTEVVLLKAALPELDEIEAVIDEPLVSWDPERVRYSGESFREAEDQILQIVEEAAWHPERRIAGRWCRHCPARIYCPQARDYLNGTLILIRPNFDIRQLPRGKEGVLFWEKISEVPDVIAEIKKAYAQILREDPDALPGYYLPAEGNERRTVTSPAGFKRALAAYLSVDEIDALAKYSIAKIQNLFGTKAGLKGKAKEKRFAELVADAIAITHDEPFIKPAKKGQIAPAESENRIIEEYDQFGRLK